MEFIDAGGLSGSTRLTGSRTFLRRRKKGDNVTDSKVLGCSPAPLQFCSSSKVWRAGEQNTQRYSKPNPSFKRTCLRQAA